MSFITSSLVVSCDAHFGFFISLATRRRAITLLKSRWWAGAAENGRSFHRLHLGSRHRALREETGETWPMSCCLLACACAPSTAGNLWTNDFFFWALNSPLSLGSIYNVPCAVIPILNWLYLVAYLATCWAFCALAVFRKNFRRAWMLWQLRKSPFWKGKKSSRDFFMAASEKRLTSRNKRRVRCFSLLVLPLQGKKKIDADASK